MYHVNRKDLPVMMQPGRKCNMGVGPDTPENTDGMMAAFAEFSYKYGKMDTHYHQNEYMYVIAAKDAVVSHGMDLEHMVTEELHGGEIVRPVKGEWHRFDFTSEDGYVDFLNFFSKFPPHTVNSQDLKK